MGKLERLRVERTDGVDRPATGHKWAVIKSETTDLSAVAKTFVEAIVKDEHELSKDAATALVALADALGIELETKAEAVETPAPAAEAAPVEDEPIVSGLFKSEEDFESKVTAIIGKALADAFGIEADVVDETEVAKGERLPASKQPEGQTPVEKGAKSGRIEKGAGLFEDVIFGQ